MRAVPEWIARHDNEAIPPRVKLRIFDACEKRCQLCTLLIAGKLKPEYDHITALINGGEHRETNLQLLCSECHAVKTRKDVGEKSVVYRKRLKAVGIRPKKPHRWGIPGMKKRMDGTVVKR